MTTAPVSRFLRLAGRIFAPTVFVAAYLVILFHWTTGSGSTVATSVAAAFTAIGSLAGLTGAFLALTQIMLQSRLPLLEAPFGRAGLVRFHKLNGYAVITILVIHAIFITTGYALANHVNVVTQDVNFLTSFPYVWWAAIALTLFTGIVGISITIVRRRLKYESWYFVHLLTYLAVLLAFKHQITVGIDFSGQSAQGIRDFWWALYIVTFASVIIFRFLRPVYRLLRFDFRVERVVPEADGINSMYVSGRNLDKLRYSAGQFMIWRFLDQDRFWQAHPFTISQAPNGKNLRLTFKASGDFTATLAQVKPGTPVLIDGPYGDFTLQDETSNKLLFVAGGIGLTPLRAMIQSLGDQDGVLLYSVRRPADVALRSELAALAKSKRLVVHYIAAEEAATGFTPGVVDAANLKALVPDYQTRAVYLCGPPPMMAAVGAMLVAAGVDADAIHTERFAF